MLSTMIGICAMQNYLCCHFRLDFRQQNEKSCTGSFVRSNPVQIHSYNLSHTVKTVPGKTHWEYKSCRSGRLRDDPGILTSFIAEYLRISRPIGAVRLYWGVSLGLSQCDRGSFFVEALLLDSFTANHSEAWRDQDTVSLIVETIQL